MDDTLKIFLTAVLPSILSVIFAMWRFGRIATKNANLIIHARGKIEEICDIVERELRDNRAILGKISRSLYSIKDSLDEQSTKIEGIQEEVEAIQGKTKFDG